MTSSAAALAVDDLRAISLFDGLTDDQVGDLVAARRRGPHRARRGPVP
jgi:hypothetical protein